MNPFKRYAAALGLAAVTTGAHAAPPAQEVNTIQDYSEHTVRMRTDRDKNNKGVPMDVLAFKDVRICNRVWPTTYNVLGQELLTEFEKCASSLTLSVRAMDPKYKDVEIKVASVPLPRDENGVRQQKYNLAFTTNGSSDNTISDASKGPYAVADYYLGAKTPYALDGQSQVATGTKLQDIFDGLPADGKFSLYYGTRVDADGTPNPLSSTCMAYLNQRQFPANACDTISRNAIFVLNGIYPAQEIDDLYNRLTAAPSKGAYSVKATDYTYNKTTVSPFKGAPSPK